MIYLIEKFRYKNCKRTTVTSNYSIDKKLNDVSTNDFNTIIKTALKKYLLQLKNLDDFGFDDEIDDNSKMYDMQYLLFQKMFNVKSNFKHLFIKFNNKEKPIVYVNKITVDVEKSYSLKNVIKYQIFLIELIRNIILVKAEYITLYETRK